MKAKILTEQELNTVLDYIDTRPNATRNKAMLLMTFWAGLSVKDLTALKVKDILDPMGTIKSDIMVNERSVLLSTKLQTVLAEYINCMDTVEQEWALFGNQKNPQKGFTENTMTQHFHYVYKGAGIEGASSHSGRRTFVNTLADKGVDMKVIQGLSGHKNISTLVGALDKNALAARKRNALDLL